MARFWIILGMVFVLSGCFGGSKTTRGTGLMNQLQLRVINLERKVEEKDREIVDLKFQVKELSSRLDSDLDMVGSDEGIVMVREPVVRKTSETTSSSVKPMKAKSDKGNIIRVPVDVKKIQSALKNAGYYKGRIDGVVGSGTKASIVQFQKNHGLVSDGIVGKKTWREMELYLDQ